MIVCERRNSRIGAEHRLGREVDTTSEQRADVGRPDSAGILCEPASRHVDRKSRIRVLDDFGFDGKLLFDVGVFLDEGFER